MYPDVYMISQSIYIFYLVISGRGYPTEGRTPAKKSFLERERGRKMARDAKKKKHSEKLSESCKNYFTKILRNLS